MMRGLAVALVALPLVASAGPHAKQQAKKHIEKATEAHRAGQYDVALAELQAAYALDAQPDYLYAIGQVHVKLGRCKEAIASYENYLSTDPPAEPAGLAQQAIDTCKQQLPPTPTPQPSRPLPATTPPPSPPRPEHEPFYADLIGSALVGGGLASLVAGGVFYVGARGTLDDADAAQTYAEHEDLVDDAHGKRNIALVLGGVGAVAVGVGVWRWLTYRREAAVIVAPVAGGGGVVGWAGRF